MAFHQSVKISAVQLFPTQDRTQASFVSCIGRWVLYRKRHLGSPQTDISYDIKISDIRYSYDIKISWQGEDIRGKNV